MYPFFENETTLLPMPDTNQLRKPTLAIISTYDELCGIAAYTIHLKKQLDDHFEVTVFDLDQFFLRHPHWRVRKTGDQHILAICRELKNFDAVNIQLEYGTIGYNENDIIRRLRWLVGAAPRLSVTFHTILEPVQFGIFRFIAEMAKGRITSARRAYVSARRTSKLAYKTYGMLRWAQKQKEVSVIVHTRRDMRMMKHVNRLTKIYDHPLVFMDESQALKFTTQASRSKFPLLAAVPENAQLIGLFGFLGPYKGFETVIRALQHLPEHYHLLIFGGVHPRSIHKEQKIDPYVRTLLNEAYVDTNIVERLGGGSDAAPSSQSRPVTVSLTLDADMAKLLQQHPRDLSRRIHFMGALPDAEFSEGMAICDTVIFPYLEVGQSSSGPISQAIELGKRIIASRTLAYLQLARYHKHTIEFFDIGNHLELAQRIAAEAAYPNYSDGVTFNTKSNMDVYLAANGQQPVGA